MSLKGKFIRFDDKVGLVVETRNLSRGRTSSWGGGSVYVRGYGGSSRGGYSETDMGGLILYVQDLKTGDVIELMIGSKPFRILASEEAAIAELERVERHNEEMMRITAQELADALDARAREEAWRRDHPVKIWDVIFGLLTVFLQFVSLPLGIFIAIFGVVFVYTGTWVLLGLPMLFVALILINYSDSGRFMINPLN